LRRFILTAFEVVADQNHFPRKVAAREGLAHLLNEGNDAVSAAIAEHNQTRSTDQPRGHGIDSRAGLQSGE